MGRMVGKQRAPLGSTAGPLSITTIASDLESYLNRQAAYVQFIFSNVESKLHIPGHAYVGTIEGENISPE